MSDPAARRIWDTALGQLELQVTRPNYDTWLKDTVGLEVENGRFVVGTPTEFVSEWLSSRMRPLITKTVSNILGRPVEVVFRLIPRNGQPPAAPAGRQGDPDGALPLSAAARSAVLSSPAPRPRLNQKYTFERFVVAECNRLAAAAALAVAERPGEVYNPLFIYGGPGLGKTHLLHAIGHRAVAAGCRVAYVTSEHFTNDFVTAIAQGRADEFRRRYRSLQALLIDDIQFLSGKERTQEEFFYTFNDLHASGCQVVVTSDRPPAAIAGLESRLCSRFQWGLIADIQPPDHEARLAILEAKAREHGVSLPREVIDLLAQHASQNVRELEGSLNRVIAFARLTSAPITPALAAEALSALTTPPQALAPDPQTVIRTVARYFNLTPQALASPSRLKPLAEARHIAMYLLREDAQLPLKQIGFLLGRRDHSTVIHGLHKVSTALDRDPRLASQIAEIRAQFHH